LIGYLPAWPEAIANKGADESNKPGHVEARIDPLPPLATGVQSGSPRCNPSFASIVLTASARVSSDARGGARPAAAGWREAAQDATRMLPLCGCESSVAIEGGSKSDTAQR